MANIKIAIDAGHGSKTGGKRTPAFTKDIDIDHDGKVDIKKGEQYREHYANVGVSNLLFNTLKSRGYDVIKTGWKDNNPKNDADTEIAKRQSIIKKEKCDYSISIHFNAFGDGKSFNQANGTGIYIHSQYPGDSYRFAKYLLKELIKGTPQKNRGIHKERLAMCNCITMGTKASVICELAFMTNQHEAMDLMANNAFWQECADEIANAVDRYLTMQNKKNIFINNINKIIKK
jgi:N-acetylmuramoyl-L-alanine amidase